MNLYQRASDGWWPKVMWPYVAYGNRAVYVTHLQTLDTYQVPDFDGYPAGWLSPVTLRCTRLLADDRNRHLYDLAVPAFGAVEGAQTWRDFSEVSASLGHWAAWDGSGQVWYDGHPLGGGYHGVRQSGEWVAARGLSGDCLYIYHCGVLVPWSADSAAIPGLSPMQDWAILGSGPLAGTVVYGRPPNLYAAYPGGTQREVSRSPWREGASYGGLGSGLQLLDVDGVPWLWSVGAIGEDVWGCLGGILGERKVVTLPIPAVALSAQVVGGEFIVAANDDVGGLRVVLVAIDAPRAKIDPPAVSASSSPSASPSVSASASESGSASSSSSASASASPSQEPEPAWWKLLIAWLLGWFK